ncbi:hypothetical protein C1N62_04555 [Nissabacter sp. SGAir0207]|nr:hypothetical protein C1N62_04555 [Nissabacter sp. SGAir0207]
MMADEWITPKELAQKTGYTEQSINQRAAKENWVKRRRPGVQGGRAHEFLLASVAPFLAQARSAQEEPATYLTHSNQPRDIWAAAFARLNRREKHLITQFILREGITGVMKKLGLAEGSPEGNDEGQHE